MSTVPIEAGTLKPPPRSALGLPAGSIRAILALMVAGMISLLIALPPRDPPRMIPPYLFYLLFIAVAHFFASHGHSIAQVRGYPSPLYLPRGTVRLLILASLAGSVSFALFRDQGAFLEQMHTMLEGVAQQTILPVVVMSGFFIGVIVRALVSHEVRSPAVHDVEAWFALISVMLISIDALAKFVIYTSLWEPPDWSTWEAIIAAVVAFYFGERVAIPPREPASGQSSACGFAFSFPPFFQKNHRRATPRQGIMKGSPGSGAPSCRIGKSAKSSSNFARSCAPRRPTGATPNCCSASSVSATRPRSPRWSTATARWCSASAAVSSATPMTPRTLFKPRSWCWCARRRRCGQTPPLGNWLYGVAYRTALKARAKTIRRRVKEQQVKERQPPGEADAVWRDLQPLLDQELNRLPDKYRVPVVLCDLEGKTRKEAAGQLHLPEGTVSSRLATARQMLAKRLTRRGLTLSGGALAVTLAESAEAAVPAALADATVRAAAVAAGGQSLGSISANILMLTEEVMKSMLLSKLKIGSVVVLLVGLLGVGAGNWLYPAAAGQTGQSGDATAPVAQQGKGGKKAGPQKRVEKKEEGKFGGIIDLNLKDVALQNALEALSEQASMNVIVERADLKEKGIPLDLPVNLRLRNVPFKTALKHLLRQARLGYTLEDGILFITSAEMAQNKMVRKVYPVEELVGEDTGVLLGGPAPVMGGMGGMPGGLGGMGGGFGGMPGGLGGMGGGFGGMPGGLGGMPGGVGVMQGGPPVTGGQLIHVITMTVGRDTWSEAGGPGSIVYLPAGGCLVVSQSSEIQDQIQTLIEELRAAKKVLDEERKKRQDVGVG